MDAGGGKSRLIMETDTEFAPRWDTQLGYARPSLEWGGGDILVGVLRGHRTNNRWSRLSRVQVIGIIKKILEPLRARSGVT